MRVLPTDEKHLSQIPALELLAQLGYEILPPQQALTRERGGKLSNVLLENILRTWLGENNRIQHRGGEYEFSDANLDAAIGKLKHLQHGGLRQNNEAIYDLLVLGCTLEQNIGGNTKSFSLRYIDWETPRNNVFHAVAEYAVSRTKSDATRRPDVVLFVNGIPLCVMECKAPSVKVEEGVSQSIRNQKKENIPQLFAYAQLLLAVNKNDARYATVGSEAQFWGSWCEQGLMAGGKFRKNLKKYKILAGLKNQPLPEEIKTAITQSLECDLVNSGKRLPTPQDAVVYSLCRPERLLDLTRRFVVFDNADKKIARYQQFFVVRETMRKIRRVNRDGRRDGGIIWHTQGSGKSLTMVMLVGALMLENNLSPRIVLATDRKDLDRQLGKTFARCGLTKKTASSGADLRRHLRNKEQIITTLIHKFDKVWSANEPADTANDIFVLVDESHRTNFGTLAAKMRALLPNACYIGFTGTPLFKHHKKNNFATFGNLIEPSYSIRQAVADKAVVPLLYEGRHVEMRQDKAAIDLWFERHTADLSPKQQADLKRKYARAQTLNEAERVVYMRAFDISEHYRANWQGSDFTAQLVAPSKAAAVRYHQHLNAIGYVSSAVVISAPDDREGHEEVEAEHGNSVMRFWQQMMEKYGDEAKYNATIIDAFVENGEPEILIVVSKLLTGFDAPRNAVLYLCRPLKEHTLLQAIARVNRLYPEKDFGYVVDYANVRDGLDDALSAYDALLSVYDPTDLAGAFASIEDEVARLPQLYSHLWDGFAGVVNKQDQEAMEIHLANDPVREEFYRDLRKYEKALDIALSSAKFIATTDDETFTRYKRERQYFQKLRQSVALRYADQIEYPNYEPKIKHLLDTHIRADDVTVLGPPADILGGDDLLVQEQGAGKTIASQADSIAHALKKVAHEKMQEDPVFYEKFSALIQQVIDEFRSGRISAKEYRKRAEECKNEMEMLASGRNDVPERIRGNDEACAFFGVIQTQFAVDNASDAQLADAAVATALRIQQILDENKRVDFWKNRDAIKEVRGTVEDFFYDEIIAKWGMKLESTQMDEILNQTMQIAEIRTQRSGME